MVERQTELRESDLILRAFRKFSGFSNRMVERTIVFVTRFGCKGSCSKDRSRVDSSFPSRTTRGREHLKVAKHAPPSAWSPLYQSSDIYTKGRSKTESCHTPSPQRTLTKGNKTELICIKDLQGRHFLADLSHP